MSFKLPLLKSRGNAKIAVHAVPNLGSFKWEEKLMRNVCAKRQTNQRETDLFMKEIRILNKLKCENVVKVEGFCSQQLAVMLEYPYFDFKPLCTQYLFRAGTLLLKLYLLQSFFEVKPVDQLNLH